MMHRMVEAVGAAEAAGDRERRTGKAQRLFFLDDTRTFLTILVVVFHVSLTYGALHGWYYYEPTTDGFAKGVLNLFQALARPFVLEVFFFISGYLVPASYDRQGPALFFRERLIRLGIPLFAFAFIVRPALVSMMGEGPATASTVVADILSFRHVAPGPLWFVEVLLVLSLAYALLRVLTGSVPIVSKAHPSLPGGSKIVLFCLALALVTFAVRLYYPIGRQWLHFRLSAFPAHVAFFVLGIGAYRGNWLNGINRTVTRRWMRVLVPAAIAFVSFFTCKVILGHQAYLLAGGWHVEAALQAAWEPFYALAMTVLLLDFFRKRSGKRQGIARVFAADSYAVFIIHAPVATLLAYSVREFTMYPLLKFAVVSFLAVVLSFLVSHFLLRPLPWIRRVV